MQFNNSNNEILVMTVEYAPGLRDQITVHGNDQPAKLATAFVHKHQIDPQVIEILTKHIHDNIELHVEKHAEKHSERPQLQSIKENYRPQSAGGNIFGSIASGQRLYDQAKMAAEQKQRHREEMKKQREDDELKYATFKPKINKSNPSSQPGSRPSSCEPSDDNIFMHGHQTNERKKARLSAYDQYEGQRCTYKPRITQKGSQARRDFDTLYQDAQRRADKANQMSASVQAQECPFRPKINKQRKVMSANSSMERLTSVQMRKANYIATEQAKREMLVDPETGQKFFEPKIGRSPRKTTLSRSHCETRNQLHSNDSSAVENYRITTAQPNQQSRLSRSHDYHDYSQDRMRALNSISNSGRNGPVVERSPSPVKLKKSDQIFQNMKASRFRAIFDTLNPTESDEIIYNCINKSYVSAEVYKVIQPILEELESLDEPLNFQEFCDAMDRLLETLSPIEKNIIIAPQKSRSRPNSPVRPSFRPKINQTRIKGRTSDLYSRLVESKKRTELKIGSMQQAKEQQEQEDCTFAPRINPRAVKNSKNGRLSIDLDESSIQLKNEYMKVFK